MSRLQVIPGLAAADYHRHLSHAPDRDWVERNCYVDVIIEMLHALGVEPLAALGVAAAVDFEGDNFTFLKPNHEDLRVMFGVDVQEMNVWLPLLEHARHHLAEGKLIATESDAFWLPDTSGTDYQRNHVKSTIILADLDEDAKRLGYFHNAGYFELAGADFDRLFRLGAGPDPTFLPLFAELVRIDRLVHRPVSELAAIAAARLSVYLGRRPADNPVRRFEDRFARELPRMQELGLPHYHAWAFATTRQLGAASELFSLHLDWLAGASGREALAPAAESFRRLSAAAKTFILKAARAVNSRKPLDPTGSFDAMATAWETGMALLDHHVGATGMAPA